MMKTLILFVSGLLLSANSVTAAEIHSENPNTKERYHYAQPIMFVERGIEFLIFPDGSFDFNTNFNDGYQNDVHDSGNSRRNSINATDKGPHINIQYSATNLGKRGVSISRDKDGKIRSIGDMYLNYDRSGNITRAGSVFMDYTRGQNATLTQVGGLHVDYNRWGEIVHTHGQVNRSNNYCNYCGGSSCKIDHSNNDTHYDNYDNQRDDNFYYFKQNGKVKMQKKSKR